MIYSILFIPIIHLTILIYVLSSKFCSAFLSGTSQLYLYELLVLLTEHGRIHYCLRKPVGRIDVGRQFR